MKDPPRGKKGERRGLFCRASWGIDYHQLVREKLSQLAIYIKERVPETAIKSMVDTGELVDRAVAERAGGLAGVARTVRLLHQNSVHTFISEK